MVHVSSGQGFVMSRSSEFARGRATSFCPITATGFRVWIIAADVTQVLAAKC